MREPQAKAFEFLGTALRGALGILDGLADEVGNGRANRPGDVLKVKRAMGGLGRYDEPEGGMSGPIDRALDIAIRGFQRDKGLRADGFLRPDGPTQRSLQDDILGLSKGETAGRRSGRGGGFDSASALRDGGGGSLLALPGFGRDPDDRGLGRSPLLDLAPGLGAGAARALEPREGDGTAGDGGRLPVGETSSRGTEPPRLKRALDKIERNLRRTVRGWREQGMTDAARHLEHFLDGSGEPITYNREQARSFSPVRGAEEDAQAQIRAAIMAEARRLKDGESRRLKIEAEPGPLTLRHGLGLLRGLLGNTDRLDDNLATGRTRLNARFEGTISHSGNDVAVDGSIDYHWYDRYDFHSGQPGADAALAVQQYRGARPFDFGGIWRQHISGTIERRRDRLQPRLSFDDVD